MRMFDVTSPSKMGRGNMLMLACYDYETSLLPWKWVSVATFLIDDRRVVSAKGTVIMQVCERFA